MILDFKNYTHLKLFLLLTNLISHRITVIICGEHGGALRAYPSEFLQTMKFQVKLLVLRPTNMGYGLRLHIFLWSPATLTQENTPVGIFPPNII